MSLSTSVARARLLTPISRSITITAVTRASESSPSASPENVPAPPKAAADAVPPLPRVKFHPKAGFTATATRRAASPPSPTAASNSTPKPPPFQERPASSPVRTSLEELQKLHPRPAPAKAAPPSAEPDARSKGAASTGAAVAGGFATPGATATATAGPSKVPFSSFSPARGRSSLAPERPPLSEPLKMSHDKPPAAEVPFKETNSLLPIVWGAVALLASLFVYEKGTALGWFGPEGGAGYMKEGRKAQADEIARKRREQWLEEVRLERHAKLKGTEPPVSPTTSNLVVPAAAVPLEVEKVAPAVAQAVSPEPAATETSGQAQVSAEAAGAGLKKRWGIF